MSPVRVLLVLLSAFTGATFTARAATPQEIEAAIQKGVHFLKKADPENGKKERDPEHMGARALVGLALLETGTPADDPVLTQITTSIRDEAYSETRTYQLTLFLLYLDRLGDPTDRPLIQLLGVRLVAGQNAEGGWTYTCIQTVPQATAQVLRAKLGEATLVAGGKETPKPTPGAKPNLPPIAGRLHAEVEKYRQNLIRTEGNKNHKDDNSNTQFGILGVWTARKHGVPVEVALERIEKRFLGTQTASGGWPYSGRADGSPSMTCVGLLGLAIAVGRREERLLKAERPTPVAKSPAPPAKPAPPPPSSDPNDPFYNPPKPKAPPEPEKKLPPLPKPRAPDARDTAITRGMDNLAAALEGVVAGKKGKGKVKGGPTDLYFLWSLERVGVIYGIEKIGRTEWYAYGANALIPTQNADGSWGRGGYGPQVNTAFALLILARSNLTRDLSAKVQRDPFATELRAGGGGPIDPIPAAPAPAPMPRPAAVVPTVIIPMKPVVPKLPAAARPGELATELFRATGADWTVLLQRVRDAKGPENTSALLAVIPLIEGDRQKQAREALAERLCRMNANTLRAMLKAEDAELRRAAALACAMKDDKGHIGDLIAALEDKNEDVAKAARAGLKSLTNKDFPTAAEWREWYAKEKK